MRTKMLETTWEAHGMGFMIFTDIIPIYFFTLKNLTPTTFHRGKKKTWLSPETKSLEIFMDLKGVKSMRVGK